MLLNKDMVLHDQKILGSDNIRFTMFRCRAVCAGPVLRAKWAVTLIQPFAISGRVRSQFTILGDT